MRFGHSDGTGSSSWRWCSAVVVASGSRHSSRSDRPRVILPADIELLGSNKRLSRSRCRVLNGVLNCVARSVVHEFIYSIHAHGVVELQLGTEATYLLQLVLGIRPTGRQFRWALLFALLNNNTEQSLRLGQLTSRLLFYSAALLRQESSASLTWKRDKYGALPVRYWAPQ